MGAGDRSGYWGQRWVLGAEMGAGDERWVLGAGMGAGMGNGDRAGCWCWVLVQLSHAGCQPRTGHRVLPSPSKALGGGGTAPRGALLGAGPSATLRTPLGQPSTARAGPGAWQDPHLWGETPRSLCSPKVTPQHPAAATSCPGDVPKGLLCPGAAGRRGSRRGDRSGRKAEQGERGKCFNSLLDSCPGSPTLAMLAGPSPASLLGAALREGEQRSPKCWKRTS